MGPMFNDNINAVCIRNNALRINRKQVIQKYSFVKIFPYFLLPYPSAGFLENHRVSDTINPIMVAQAHVVNA